jgi:phage baseplate assembly protein W
MAFGAQQIFPIDLDNSAAVGIDLPLNGPAVFKSNFQTKDAIKSELINFLLTNPGERYLNPLFGAGLRDFIFSQISDGNLEFLKQDLQSKIQANFPNIRVDTLEVLRNDDINTITVSFTYSVINTNLTDEITLSFT